MECWFEVGRRGKETGHKWPVAVYTWDRGKFMYDKEKSIEAEGFDA